MNPTLPWGRKLPSQATLEKARGKVGLCQQSIGKGTIQTEEAAGAETQRCGSSVMRGDIAEGDTGKVKIGEASRIL